MKRTFSFAGVKKISLRHQEIKSILSEIGQIDKKYRKNVEKVADEYINSEIMRVPHILIYLKAFATICWWLMKHII